MVSHLGRIFFVGALLLGPFVGNLCGGGLAIDGVSIGRHGAPDFARISHYFSGNRAKFRHGLYRSDAGREEGTYAIAFLNKSLGDFNGDLGVSLEFVVAGDPLVHKIGGTVVKSRNSRELWIGITDERWSHLTAGDLLAWRIALSDGRGEICSNSSFLFPSGGQEVKKLATDASDDSK